MPSVNLTIFLVIPSFMSLRYIISKIDRNSPHSKVFQIYLFTTTLCVMSVSHCGTQIFLNTISGLLMPWFFDLNILFFEVLLSFGYVES